jgi:hypothetical protein
MLFLTIIRLLQVYSYVLAKALQLLAKALHVLATLNK